MEILVSSRGHPGEDGTEELVINLTVKFEALFLSWRGHRGTMTCALLSNRTKPSHMVIRSHQSRSSTSEGLVNLLAG